MKKLFLIIAALVMALSITACTVDPSDDGSNTKMITVYMNIDFPDADDEEVAPGTVCPPDIEDYKMKVEEGATMMQILESFASQNDLEVLVDTTSPTVYVTSIGGVAQTATAGWMYEINDETIWEEAGTYTPAHRDEITWEFSDFQ
ncbi:MAG: DUF4430 domain-containing protein [Firmicutes bacterium]|nr:DUF4430 domain-containing protein [Bacillota bacterium]